MHRCFQLPGGEIVERICFHLDRQGDLTALARASKVFSSHALRVIWESVSLVNLLRCLPSDAYSTEMGHGIWIMVLGGVGSLELLGTLQDGDFDRIRLYAPYIQHLFCDMKIPFTEADRDGVYFLDHFLTPQITSIRIPAYRGHGGATTFMLLVKLPICCPQLQDLTCVTRYPSSDAAATSVVSSCVARLNSLRTLNMDLLDQAALAHLSRLSSLQHLRLKAFPSDFPAAEDGAYFQFLQTLHFHSDIHSVSQFLERGRRIPLVEFKCESSTSAMADEVDRLFSAVSGAISHPTLEQFSLDNGYISDELTDLIRSSSIRSLFCFVNLTFLSILSTTGIDWDDATVTDMARSWPRIKSLELLAFRGTAAPRATLRSLEAFAQYCPDLTALGIAFDAISVPTLSASNFSLPALTWLDVEASPVSEPHAVAMFLEAILPRLETLQTLVDGAGSEETLQLEYDEVWKEVDAIRKGS
ncbi:hypothetical protein FB45DRAFT_1150273 [Roridomyces roridus]|uniref:F-box domain-containing protein n=1 Tax=Roridomyces roridus TaxID=1738132 RepID=A0AAD7FNQ0_9AGAR|nr:hypothetical protein FB45DRAFT_1150273 [Roridomyces roridus]